ncbi:hypothetical protein U4E84_04365 [Halorubrum sp. AD140]|uniref:hypothetical protein n=1 Tax=Halorubrum sp. AD140 TaxID=3050073 RepID=UPI002ACC8C00|nr:hypothetical protein [Halorubrum sp. AD140]MDZ5810581.1 hypothetical protein [Halorubrum sp. AD140]
MDERVDAADESKAGRAAASETRTGRADERDEAGVLARVRRVISEAVSVVVDAVLDAI